MGVDPVPGGEGESDLGCGSHREGVDVGVTDSLPRRPSR